MTGRDVVSGFDHDLRTCDNNIIRRTHFDVFDMNAVDRSIKTSVFRTSKPSLVSFRDVLFGSCCGYDLILRTAVVPLPLGHKAGMLEPYRGLCSSL